MQSQSLFIQMEIQSLVVLDKSSPVGKQGAMNCIGILKKQIQSSTKPLTSKFHDQQTSTSASECS